MGQLKGFVVGVVVGLLLGGVAWASHDEVDGVTYAVHGWAGFDLRTRSLVAARGRLAEAQETVERLRRRGAPDYGARDMQIVEQRCTSRVIETYHPK